jgi:hypothetical protein
VDFRADFFLGLQRHEDELAVVCRVQHPAKLVILDGETLDVLDKAFHDHSSVVLQAETCARAVRRVDHADEANYQSHQTD